MDHRLAQVRFSVVKGHRLPASTTATIKYLNLVGQRFLELAQGTGAAGDLPPGGTKGWLRRPSLCGSAA